MTDQFQADLAACRDLLRVGSKSFHAASLLLPRRVRDPATALYAFCRLGDDAVDEAQDAALGLAEMRARLDAAYRGEPIDHPADRAFAHVVAQHAMPRELPEALLDGFAWDASGRRYETLEDVYGYAARVAGTVGAMMTLLMGVRRHAALARATDLGTAMQLTNIARDVGEDARNGRLYLPRQWLREADIDPDAFLAAPRFSAGVASVTARLLAEATRLYARAEAGIAMLPRDCRPAIRAAHSIYAEIGAEVVRAGYDSVSRRAVVTSKRKIALLAQAWLPGMPRRAVPHEPPLAANAYLVHAVPATELAIGAQSLGDRIGWAIELFAQLEERQRLAERDIAPNAG
ncbi:phytoene/squalene synthase family protein [Sediminicoccus sp. KRV36]|uniref:phytoene/squalene synthase family protein n=1 Tax=Sediminicoccus sp. KRV36 TaxID=3133721 RepID=UPI00200BF769|nr:phytoene/squalene synthase family protein [Sediminicoccus rosea]UPY35319.1 phytoene/squalene synthase family protein [Sediminicoccus rosea]